MANFHEVAALVIFVAVIVATMLLVLVPVSLPLPAALARRCKLPQRVSISYAAVPVVGALLMLCTGVLDGASFATGIVGDEHLKPYGIVILFMALAFMAASLDMTGCFQWLALHITRLSKGNGLALFVLYWSLSSVITIFTSNDVSIMTLTPIILYCALATGADPIPFLTAMFTAANIWSMLLFVGNPTNIIVAMAYKMSFLDYTKWMAFPTIGAGFVAFAAVLAVHWRSVPRRLSLPDLHPSVMLVDKPGAVFGSANIFVCLILLAASPALKWELWVVTLCCALLHALYNFAAYVVYRGRWCSRQHGSRPEGACGVGAADDSEHGVGVAAEAAAEAGLQQHKAEGAQLELVGLQQPQSLQGGQQVVSGCRHSAGLIPGEQQGSQHWNSGDDAAAAVVAPAAVASSAAGLHHRQPAHAGTSAAAAAAAEPEVSNSAGEADDPGLLRVWNSRHQLLTAEQQHAACSDAAVAEMSKPAVADLFGPPGEPAAVAAGGTASAADTALQEAVGFNNIRQGLQPPPIPTFWRAVVVLPWEIVPFVLGMFCVVEGLNANGWVELLAAWLAGGLGGSVWGALFAIGGLSLVLANIINNQPMTILMTRVCMSPAFLAPLAAASAGQHAAAVPLASAFAVVVASNTAANFSIMGALAGIMFVNILKQRGFQVSSWSFTKLMVPAGVSSTLFALLILGAELVTWNVVG